MCPSVAERASACTRTGHAGLLAGWFAIGAARRVAGGYRGDVLQGFSRHLPVLSTPAASPWPWTTDPLPAPIDAVRPGDTVVCAAGAGDRAMAYVAAGAARVIGVGPPAALALGQLKVAARVALRPVERRQLWGLEPGGRRVWLLHRVVAALPPAARAFWASHERWVRTGLDQAGQLEQIVTPSPRADSAAARWRALRRVWAGSRVVWPGEPPTIARAPAGPLEDPWWCRVVTGGWGDHPPVWLTGDPLDAGCFGWVDATDAEAVASAAASADLVDKTHLPLLATGRWVAQARGADPSPWGGRRDVSP